VSFIARIFYFVRESCWRRWPFVILILECRGLPSLLQLDDHGLLFVFSSFHPLPICRSNRFIRRSDTILKHQPSHNPYSQSHARGRGTHSLSLTRLEADEMKDAEAELESKAEAEILGAVAAMSRI
jgi:hypothetical protein